MKVVRTHNSKISTYLNKTNNLIFAWAACEYYSAMTLHFSSDRKLNGAELRPTCGADTWQPNTNTNTINFLSPQSQKILSVYCWFLAYFETVSLDQNASLPAILCTFLETAELELGYPHMPHGLHMLSVSEVASKRSNSAPSDFSLSLAPSKGHRTEQSQSWEGSEPIHIKFSSPSHAWEVLKYFLKYSRMHGVRIMGSTWLSSENGKRCRHCEVQTRHSDLDSTGHWTQVWLHLHLQLNGHSQIYWMTSTVCCLATDKTRTENSENGKGDGKTTRIFFLKPYTFYISYTHTYLWYILWIFYSVDFLILCCQDIKIMCVVVTLFLTTTAMDRREGETLY